MINIVNALKKIHKDDPDGFSFAISLAFTNRIADEYAEFIDGLDLNEKDKQFILDGFLAREADKWDDEEEAEKFFKKAYDIYQRLTVLEEQLKAKERTK